MKCRILSLHSLFYLVSISGYASSQTGSQTELSTSFERPSELQMYAEFQHFSYISANKNFFAADQKADQMSTVGMGFYLPEQTSIDARWFYSEQEEQHYFDVREWSYRSSKKSTHKMWIGRHLESWSATDDFWGMGLWQPRFNWDRLRPNTNGLTGLFYEPKISAKNRLMLFASPFYVPEMGTGYKEEDGTVKSVNPWMRTPPPFLELFEQPTDITARVDEPLYSDVLFNTSYGLIAEQKLSSEENLRLSYAYKPMNQLFMAFEYYIVPPGGWSADFTFFPRVVYHHITTLGYHRKNDLWSADFSWTYDSPKLDKRPDHEISQSRKDMTILAANASRRIDGVGKSATQVYGGVTLMNGYFDPDKGENAQEITLFDTIPKYYHAAKLGVSRTRYKKNGVFIEQKRAVEMVYDWQQQGGIFMAEYSVMPVKDLFVSLKVDILGVTKSLDSNSTYARGFINTFRANDRLQLDVSYVF